MENSGIIKCKYHPTNLNVSWCSSCGNPICEECIAELPNWMVGFGYPDICPTCKHKKINFNIKIVLIIFGFLTIIPFVFLFYQIFDFIYHIIGLMLAVGFFSYFIIIFLRERKKYNLWKKSTKERSISNEELQDLIQNQQLKPCYYHNEIPGINNCEDCEKDICVNCTIISTRFMGAHISCIEHFWIKTKRDLKIFMYLFVIPLILLLIIFFSMTIIYWDRNPYSFYIIMSLACLFDGIILFSLIYYYKRTKKKYIKWKTQIKMKNQN